MSGGQTSDEIGEDFSGFFNVPSPASFSLICCRAKQIIQFLQQINKKNVLQV